MIKLPISQIPTFLKSKTPEGLRKKMMVNNIKMQAHVPYFDISFVNGFWYAWFMLEEKDVNLLKMKDE